MREKRNNNYRGKIFGVVINPKIEGESIDWKNLSQLEVEEKLNELDFIGKSCLTLALNKLEFTNVNKNKSVIEDFEGQLELGSKYSSHIRYYTVYSFKLTILTIFKRDSFGNFM